MVEYSENCVIIQNKTTIYEIICTLKETARLHVKTRDKNDRDKSDRMINDNGFE